MKLRDLSKPQWDAARAAAGVLRTPGMSADERLVAYRRALDKLKATLPYGTKAAPIVSEALRWESLNDLAEVLCGVAAPISFVPQGRD